MATDRVQRLHEMADRAAAALLDDPERLRALRRFTDYWLAIEAYTPPQDVVADVLQCVEFMVRLADETQAARPIPERP